MNSEIQMYLEKGDEALAEKDKTTAIEFYQAALELGSEDAKERLEKLNPKMINPEIARSIQEKKDSKQLATLNEGVSGLNNMKGYIIGSIVVQAILSLAILLNGELSALLILIPSVIVNSCVIGLIDTVVRLTHQITEMQKKSKN